MARQRPVVSNLLKENINYRLIQLNDRGDIGTPNRNPPAIGSLRWEVTNVGWLGKLGIALRHDGTVHVKQYPIRMAARIPHVILHEK